MTAVDPKQPYASSSYFETAQSMIRIIAAFQIFGASSLATILLSDLMRVEQTVIGMLFVLVGISICVLAFVSGFGLWDKKPFGYKGSLIAQVLQIPVIFVDGLLYRIILGLGVNVGWTDEGYWFTGGWSFLGDFTVRIGGGVSPHTVAINLVALVIAAYLYRRRGEFGIGTASSTEI